MTNKDNIPVTPPELFHLFEDEPTEKSFEWIQYEIKKGTIDKEAKELLDELDLTDEFDL